MAQNAPDIQYIVYVRADGPLGNDLGNYWRAVLPTDLCHQAIKQYPPHCSITGFFYPSHDETYYLEAIEQALINTDTLGYSRTVTVNSSIQHGKTLDYLKLSSTYLEVFGEEFVTLVNLPISLVKGPPGFTFHITLRDHVFKTTGKLQRIQKMQNDYIHLSDSAGWLIYLYKKENDVLTPIGEPIRLIPSP